MSIPPCNRQSGYEANEAGQSNSVPYVFSHRRLEVPFVVRMRCGPVHNRPPLHYYSFSLSLSFSRVSNPADRSNSIAARD